MRSARWLFGLVAAIFLLGAAHSPSEASDPDAPIRGVPGPTLFPRTIDVGALPDVPGGVCSADAPRDVRRGPEPEVPHGLPVPPGARILLERPSATAPARGEAVRAAPAQILDATPPLDASFAALPDDTATSPPDTNGAASPSQVVTMLNSQFRVQDRSGNPAKTVSIAAFWGKPETTFLTDPRILYSAGSARWYAVTLVGRNSPAGVSVSEFLVGVSRTDDATGVWDSYTVPVGSATEGYSGDFPTVGYSRSRFVVQLNLFDVFFNSFQGSRIYVFDRAALESGTLVQPTQISASAFGSTQVPSVAADPDAEGMYLVEDWNGNDPEGGLMRLFQITGPPGGESLVPVAFFGTPERWLDFPPGDGNLGPQMGSTTGIAANDANIGSSVVYRNGFLWAAHTVFLPADAPVRSAVQWWQVATDGTIAQRGRIDDPSGKFFYAFPSIAVNQDNHVVVGCARFSADAFAGAVYAYRAAADPAGTLRVEETLKAGEATYVKVGSGDDRNRWGDYSAAVTDPGDDAGFWVLQEYAAAASAWGTWWGHLSAEPPIAPSSRFELPDRPPAALAPAGFHDTSTGGPVSWKWSFGDGTESTAKDPQKLYALPGTYKVTLTVSNRAGSSTSSATVKVLAAPTRDPRRIPRRPHTPREITR